MQNVTIDIILKYFTKLTEDQIRQLSALYGIFEEWNNQINVISRKDFEFFYLKHVLHSLGIAKYHAFEDGMNVLDIGSGGGLPGIPLAILFPKVNFTLLDSIKKKMTVAREVSDHIGLKNTKIVIDRSESFKERHNIIVSRAVTQLPKFVAQSKHLLDWQDPKSCILYLKGGDFQEELSQLRYKYNVVNLTEYFEEEFFETKKIVKIYR
ncbi:MAG: 16S rRNA (guanine527-N7)-methyltransferase [Patiriisocius sp.]|jgi:16S rRNA (guanine527-N7)-methyltransferase